MWIHSSVLTWRGWGRLNPRRRWWCQSHRCLLWAGEPRWAPRWLYHVQKPATTQKYPTNILHTQQDFTVCNFRIVDVTLRHFDNNSFVLWRLHKLTRRKGMMPSLEMAWSSRGAPVRLWSPAPQVEKKEPNTITHGDGHAKVPITRLPLTPSPNLKKKECAHISHLRCKTCFAFYIFEFLFSFLLNWTLYWAM